MWYEETVETKPCDQQEAEDSSPYAAHKEIFYAHIMLRMSYFLGYISYNRRFAVSSTAVFRCLFVIITTVFLVIKVLALY
jgi:hypothetical protein